MRPTRNFREKRERQIGQNAKIRARVEAVKRKRLADAKAKNAAIRTLKKRFLDTRATIVLLEAELRRFTRLLDITETQKQSIAEEKFVQPKKARRKWEIIAERQIKSTPDKGKRRKLIEQKRRQLIRKIDRLSMKEGKIKNELKALWGPEEAMINLMSFIKTEVGPDAWASPKEHPPSALRRGKATH